MITITLPDEDAERIAYALGDYAFEDFEDAEKEAANGDAELLRTCAHLDYLAAIVDPSNPHF